MDTIFNDIELTSEYTGKKSALFDTDGTTMERHWTIKCKKEDREIEFDYYPSKANPYVDTEEEILEAFECFLSDAVYGFESLDDVYNELGCNGSISQFIATYNACVDAGEKLKYLLGTSDTSDIEELREDLYKVLGW